MTYLETSPEPETVAEQGTSGGFSVATSSEIFSADTSPNDGEQVVCIRADGWWEKGAWHARFDGWMVNGMRQDIKFWMRVFIPNDQAHSQKGRERGPTNTH